MTPSLVNQWLARKERSTVEFKEARQALPGDLFETVCAFLNRDGGVILLGVADDGTIEGVEPAAVERLTKDVVNLSNNPQKLEPPFILSPTTVEIEGKQILVLQVPASSDIHRCVGVVYDRGHDGDYAVKDPNRIAGMVNRKRGLYTEMQVYPHLRFVDFEPRVLDTARRLIASRQPDHPWLRLTDEELLAQAGFWRRDLATATEGYTLAAGLMFGREEVILSMLPHYRTDALVRRVNLDRYDDRIDVRINLVDAYDQLMQFIAKHLPDPFFMEGDGRVSLREKIFRELISNLLVHREYLDAQPATLTVFKDRLEIVNATHPHGHGPLIAGQFTPYPKNPVIARFFRQMGRAEELGSGILNVTKYLPHYVTGGQAQFIEGSPFRTIIPLPPETAAPQVTGQVAGQVTGQVAEEVAAEVRRVLMTLHGEQSRMELQNALQLKSRANFEERYLKPSLAAGVIEPTIPDKPKSRLQKYRLTAKGAAAVQALKKP